MSADVFRELLRDFRAAEAEWPVKGYTQFKIWARPFLHNGRPEPGWLPRYNEEYEEWHLASFRVDSREWGYHIFTHIGCVGDEKPVERFTELATKAGAHLSLHFQDQISPKPNGSVDSWLALMWRLFPADDTEYGDKPRIFLDDPFFDSANAIEHCQLHTDEPMWPGPVWPRDTNSPKAEPADNTKGIATVAVDEEDQSARTGVADGRDATEEKGDDDGDGQQTDMDTSGIGGANNDVRANNPKLFSAGFPDDPDLLGLAVKIDQAQGEEDDKKKSDRQIARDFTGESKESQKRSLSLLSALGRERRKKTYHPA